jgi:sterol desaturase/sphingolipid hydroxylase (fatty acid hydroxylase superfamily)
LKGSELNWLVRRTYDFKGFPVLAATVCILFLLEKRFELRKRKFPVLKRLQTNTVMAVIAGIGMRLAIIPLVVRAADYGHSNRFGLFKWRLLPGAVKSIAGLLLLDYGSYRWHRLNHKSNLLWRFHQVHHSDPDLDVSTALRFHIGEVLLSAFYRAAWALLTGVSPKLALAYEVIFELATNFHHTNLRLPQNTDRALAQFIVTPRMHGIHHSVIKDETDSNYSVVLTIWDKLHRSYRLDIPQHLIEIGIPYVRDHLKVQELLTLPFTKTSEWKFPDGTVPMR